MPQIFQKCFSTMRCCGLRRLECRLEARLADIYFLCKPTLALLAKAPYNYTVCSATGSSNTGKLAKKRVPARLTPSATRRLSSVVQTTRFLSLTAELSFGSAELPETDLIRSRNVS